MLAIWLSCVHLLLTFMQAPGINVFYRSQHLTALYSYSCKLKQACNQQTLLCLMLWTTHEMHLHIACLLGCFIQLTTCSSPRTSILMRVWSVLWSLEVEIMHPKIHQQTKINVKQKVVDVFAFDSGRYLLAPRTSCLP